MPRGLGDDPLSRKKSRRAGISSDVPPVATESNPPAASDSYNDVFFQRRAETPVIVSPVPEALTVEPEISAAAPIIAMEAPQPEPAAQVAVPEVIAPVPEVAVVAPEAAQVAPEGVQWAPEIVQSATEPTPQVATQPADQEAQKGGFFTRIFGKLRR